MRLKQFVTATITPAIIIIALLVVAVLHFRSTLTLAEQRDQLFRGSVFYSAAPLQMEFQRDAGARRPSIQYDQQQMVQYTEWSSSVVVDGAVYSLWDQNHGYSFDDAHKQVFSTVNGPGWQVIETITVRASDVQVSYAFVSLYQTNVAPAHEVTLVLIHEQSYWLNPTVAGTTFQTGITRQPLSKIKTGVRIQPTWLLAVRANPANGVHAVVQIVGARSAYDPVSGSSETWANQFTTTYTLLDPQPNSIVPVATETISVQRTSSGS